jgi:guanylate kinase
MKGLSGPLLIVITGPSGVGKDTVIGHLRKLGRPWHFVVTATARMPRPTEQDGVHYIFMDSRSFRKQISEGSFLEYAEVYGELYGVPRAQVREALGSGKDVVIKVDIQGAQTIKRIVPDGVFIFLAPPSVEELERRLVGRNTESSQGLAVRLSKVREEMAQLGACDYLVVNRDNDPAYAAVCIDAIITAEKCRIRCRHISV